MQLKTHKLRNCCYSYMLIIGNEHLIILLEPSSGPHVQGSLIKISSENKIISLLTKVKFAYSEVFALVGC